MNINQILLKLKSRIYFFFNLLLVDIFLISMIFLLFLFIFNLCFTNITYCDSIDDIVSAPASVSENECISNNDETSTRAGLEVSPSLWLKYRLIIRRKLYWYIKGYNSGQYTSYGEFKEAWRPEMSLRREFRDSLRNAMRDPLADIAKTRDKVNRVTENSRKMDAILAEERRINRIAEHNRDMSRLNKGLGK